MTDWTDEARAFLEERAEALEACAREYGHAPTEAGFIRAALGELERLQRDLTAVIGAAQRFQPGGSPPPGSSEMLVSWICRSLCDRAEAAAPHGGDRDGP